MNVLAFILILVILLDFSAFAQQSPCDYKVEIIVDGEEFEKEEFKWKMRATKLEGKSTNITGTAKIEDSSGKITKTYKPWSSDSISKQKTSSEYSPNLKPGEYKITAEISVECDDINKENNIDSKTVKIKGEEKINAQKGSQTKETASKAQNEEITIIPKAENSVTKLEKPTAIEGIAQTTQNITTAKPEESTADEETDNVIKSTNKNSQKPQLTASAVQEPIIIYESSDEKAKNLIIGVLLMLSILLNIVLIWRR